ncbi:DUF262 domain-containing HNH endonuclease family protein [Nostoc sp. NMS4]|uniref:DUF262 domain-containing protein n=1 Tax=Nostoc sp. NMS4 TaxID=2815390 RepID=UPI0025CFAA89|nr:DUF262 domain-containing HNH endonuclease family protein [Nostoc sp. NMS4]MBN3922637.1 DUF262 domain-containing protein [Nostoc sp. NMS4]
MSTVKIQATEYSISKVFSNDFVFTIPLYQRPYAWTTEQAGELLEDLITALGDGNKTIDEINPYFLGSIVLIKRDKPDAQVVDGQQRLTTLTILIAVLRTLLPKEQTNHLTKYLYQEGDPFEGTCNIYRLRLRERDAQFFNEYIQDECGIGKLQDLNVSKKSDSCKKIKENGLLFIQRLRQFNESQLFRLVQFIVTRCFIVVVSSPDFDSAYRIFSVLNNRGLDLSPTDILKADIIGEIPDIEKEQYNSKWEEIEDYLGRDDFKELFSHIRMIYRKAKLADTIIKEIREYVKPLVNPQNFINKTLIPLADSFEQVKRTSYTSTNRASEVNKLFEWLNRIDNSDWIPPAILYLSKNCNDSEKLVYFFTDLERLTAGLMIKRANINERIGRYGRLLTAIDKEEDLYKPDSPLQLTSEERNDILDILKKDLYLIEKIRLYVLLRLDAALTGGDASYNFPTITVEHVLPQSPNPNSVWVQWFPDQKERGNFVHLLGNLLLLSRKKNSEAQNYDFAKKKEIYFTGKTGVSPFALTTQVLKEQEWTPEVINKRQKHLIDKLKEIWRL